MQIKEVIICITKARLSAYKYLPREINIVEKQKISETLKFNRQKNNLHLNKIAHSTNNKVKTCQVNFYFIFSRRHAWLSTIFNWKVSSQ